MCVRIICLKLMEDSARLFLLFGVVGLFLCMLAEGTLCIVTPKGHRLQDKSVSLRLCVLFDPYAIATGYF